MKFDKQKAREACKGISPGPWIYGIYPDNCDLCEDCEYDPREHKDLDCPNPIKQSWKPIAMIGDGYCVPGIYAPNAGLDNANENGKFIELVRSMFPSALDRIEELEDELIQERADALACAEYEPPMTMAGLKALAREQLQSEGKL